MQVLVCGETAGGSAAYLLSILRAMGAGIRHVPSSALLTPAEAERRVDVTIFSDFPSAHAPAAAQRRLAARAWDGAMGLLMIGGWGSFAGPHGRWTGTPIAQALPVACADSDDRVNCASGAAVVPARAEALLAGLGQGSLPIICGFNRVAVRARGHVVLEAQPLAIRQDTGTVAVRPAGARAPLLVLDRDPCRRIAALMTDLAPHWCGGLVDWGARRVRLRDRAARVEVGDRYVALVTRLIRRLARDRCSC